MCSKGICIRFKVIGKPAALWILISGILVCGCSSRVKLQPSVASHPNFERLPISVGFYHAQEFLTYQRSFDAYGNGHQFIFPLGSASDALFREIYPKIFEDVEQVDALPSKAAPSEKLVGVIAPEIEDFQFPLQNLKGPYWADIIHRFKVYSPEGKVLLSWKAMGWGESGDGSIYGEFGPIADSADKAMQDAASRFIRSFKDVPEVKRWLCGMPIEGATASPDKQLTRPSLNLAEGSTEYFYEGVVAVRAKTLLEPGYQTATEKISRNKAAIVGIELFIENTGSRQLVLHPSNISLELEHEQEINSVPASFVASAITTHYVMIGPVAPGTGLAAIPSLIVSLINAASSEAERRELKSNLEKYRNQELHDAVLREAESIRGLVFFRVMPAKSVSGELKVPVIETESATRYLIRIPIKISSSN